MDNVQNAFEKEPIFAIFGCGGVYTSLKEKLNQLNIKYYFDNKYKKGFDDQIPETVLCPDMISEFDIDYVIITCNAIGEIEQQLHSLGIPDKKIVTFRDIDKFVYLYGDVEGRKNVYKELEKCASIQKKPKILLISNELSFSGAVTALFYMSKLLKEHNYYVAVVSVKPDNGMMNYFLDEDIDVFYEGYLSFDNTLFWNYARAFDIIFVNTMILQDVILNLKCLSAKKIWWIHESDDRCNSLNEISRDDLPENLHIYGVGNRVINTVKSIWGEDFEISSLLYGIPDEKVIPMKHDIITVAVVGALYSVKGQDIFIKAIELLNDKCRNKAEFLIIGKALDPVMRETVINAAEKQTIKYVGELSRNEMNEKYKDIDVVVVPSRRDTMPMVAAEAMMNKKIVIVSDVTGTAELIEDGINGFVFEKSNIRELSRVLADVIYNFDRYNYMKENARLTYEKFFSLKSYEENLLDVFSCTN